MGQPIMRELMNMLHRGSHWDPQAMCDALLKVYGCTTIYTIAKQVCKSCITYQRITKKCMRKPVPGERLLRIRSFQSIQIDFTEIPKVGKLKYLVVIVDHFTGWVEAHSLTTTMAGSVIKVLLEQVIPRFELIENVDSDNRSHFTSKVLQGIMIII